MLVVGASRDCLDISFLSYYFSFLPLSGSGLDID